MNCVSSTADVYRDVQYIANPILLLEDQYATIPVAAVKPACQQTDEEQLHTSFEQAISDRVLAVNRQLSRLSGPITDTGYGYVQPHTDELVQQDIPVMTGMTGMTVPLPAVVNPSGHVNIWQQIVLMVCLCLMLVLLGFDLMGVLIVYGGH
jgi:hypothetical protein